MIARSTLAPLALLIVASPAPALGSSASQGGDPLTAIDSIKIDKDAFPALDLVDPGDEFGSAVASLGDLDGDGFRDIAVGARFADGLPGGEVLILFLDGEGDVRDATRIKGEGNGGGFGTAIVSLGDLNGDGTCDLVVTQPGLGGGSIGGGFWVTLLNPDGTVLDRRLTLPAQFPGAVGALEGFTDSIANIGDVDGDGVVDLAIGSPQGDFGTPNYGHVWIAFLKVDGTVRKATKIGFGEGGLSATLEEFGRFGEAVVGLGDLDRDGIPDLAVGAPGVAALASKNRVLVLFLQADGTVRDFALITAGGASPVGPVDPFGRFGAALAAIVEPGEPRQLLVGAPRLSGSSGSAGRVFVLDLAPDGSVLGSTRIGPGLDGFPAPGNVPDQFGSSIALLKPPVSNGWYQLSVGAIGDDDGGDRSGAVWNLALDGSNRVMEQRRLAGQFSAPPSESELGRSVARLPDLDGDGIPELALGAPRDTLDGPAITGTGAVWIVFPNADGSVRSYQRIGRGTGGLQADWGFTEGFGEAVASLGDLDGDGTADLAVGLPHSGFFGTGRVVILFLRPDGTVRAEQEIGFALGGFSGTLIDKDEFGQSIASLGDVDGDGVIDLAVGAPGSLTTSTESAVWLLFLTPDGRVKSELRIDQGTSGFSGPLGTDPSFGAGVAGLGDLDGDGTPDLAVGDPTDGDSRGAAWILHLNPDGTVRAQTKITDGVGGFQGPLQDVSWFGQDLCAVGDLDGDGVTELAVGAPLTDPSGPGLVNNTGAVWLLALAPDGTVLDSGLIDRDSAPHLELSHEDRFGTGLGALGDWDGDGVPDLLVGAPFESLPATEDVGAAFIVTLTGTTGPAF